LLTWSRNARWRRVCAFVIDYVLGYSLWIVIPIVALVYLIGWMRKKKAPAAAAPAA